jgi:hypothetical protein
MVFAESPDFSGGCLAGMEGRKSDFLTAPVAEALFAFL